MIKYFNRCFCYTHIDLIFDILIRHGVVHLVYCDVIVVKKANNKEAYDEIADQIFALREKRQQASMDTVQRDEQLQRITELQDFIKDQSSDLTVFDEALVKRWLKQITIWDDHCTVELKSGLKVDVER